jgi:hypothetical protein
VKKACRLPFGLGGTPSLLLAEVLSILQVAKCVDALVGIRRSSTSPGWVGRDQANDGAGPEQWLGGLDFQQ